MQKGINDMNIIVVDSVKGGCGKTSISLKYAIKLANVKSNKVCYLDLDLLGSSIEVFLTGEKFVGQLQYKTVSNDLHPIALAVKKTAKYYLNDVFKGERFSKRFLNDIMIGGSGSEKGIFSLISCNPNQDEKDRFKPSRLMNYMGQIDYDYFAAMIEKVFEQLVDMKFTHVIIDMPPNSDAYTDSLFNILLRKYDSRDREETKTKFNVEICIINSFDRAHFSANLEWLKTMIREHDMKWVVDIPKLFKIVFNDNINYNKIDNNIDYNKNDNNNAKEYVRKMLQELNENGINIDSAYLYEYDKNSVASSTGDGGIGFGTTREILVTKEKEKGKV